MKKLFTFVLAAIAAACFALSGCSGTNVNTVFTLKSVKPWEAVSYEKSVYEYVKSDESGKIYATGTYTVEVTVGESETTIQSSLYVYDTEGTLTDTMSSSVRADSKSLYPHYSVKLIRNEIEDDGYSVEMDYENGKSYYTYLKDGKTESDIALSAPGQDTFDNEELYFIVRAADNLTAENNTGTFGLVNGRDSYLAGKLKTYSMRYSVGAVGSVRCSSLAGKFGISQDGNIPCRVITSRINATQTGSDTVLKLSLSGFEGGANAVLLQIQRPQYDVSALKLAYNHTYTLKDYSVTK